MTHIYINLVYILNVSKVKAHIIFRNIYIVKIEPKSKNDFYKNDFYKNDYQNHF